VLLEELRVPDRGEALDEVERAEDQQQRPGKHDPAIAALVVRVLAVGLGLNLHWGV